MSRPLDGRIILVTRPKGQAAVFCELLRRQGAVTLEIAAIELVPVEDYEPLRRSLDRLEAYDWVLVTSANTVHFLAAKLAEWGIELAKLGQTRVAAIGPATRDSLLAHSIAVDLVAEDSRAEGLLAALLAYEGGLCLTGRKILLPRAEKARDTLPAALRALGVHVDDVPLYRSVAPRIDFAELERQLAGRRPDLITFTSSQAARNFTQAAEGADWSECLKSVPTAVIGPVTAKTLEALGLRVDIMPDCYNIADLTEAIVAYFSRLNTLAGS